MKSFSIVCLTTAILLFYTIQTGRHLLPVRAVYVPKIVHNLKLDIQSHFKKTEYANLMMAFFTGQKQGIGSRTIKDLKKVNLIFLLSPSGFHLGVILLLLKALISSLASSRLKKKLIPFFLLIMSIQAYFFSYQAFIRSLSLRLFIRIKFKFKIKLNIELMTLLIFIISFALGHYHASPLSYVMSFAFLGTFICLRDYGKIHLIVGLFIIQLIINLFLAQKVSLISIAIGLLAVFIFKYLFMLIIIYLMSFYLYPTNWIEPLIKLYMILVRFFATEMRGTFTSSSIFLIFGLYALLALKRFTKSKPLIIALCLFLHTNTAKAPAISFYF